MLKKRICLRLQIATARLPARRERNAANWRFNFSIADAPTPPLKTKLKKLGGIRSRAA
jgi:hypothetical protein